VSNPTPQGRASRIWRSAVAALRRPLLILSAVGALAVGAGLAASLPQQPDAEAVERFRTGWPLLAPVAGALGLHEVTTSWWFLALVGLAFASLLAVQVEQWRRVRRTFGAGPSLASLAAAPLRFELPVADCRRLPSAPLLQRSGRLGLLGSPLFHLGLLVAVAFAPVRLLWFRDAMVRVAEGQVLDTGPDAFPAQRGGRLSVPFVLPAPLQVREIRPTLYPTSALMQVEATVALGEGEGAPSHHLAINTPLDVGGGRTLYITSSYGALAQCRIMSATGEAERVVALHPAGDEIRGRFTTEDGREIRLQGKAAGGRPDGLYVRSLRDGALLGYGLAGLGGEVGIGGGERLRLEGYSWTVDLKGAQDRSRAGFFAGVALVLTGVVLMFSVVPIDTGVFVRGDRLVLAVRPHRFAPLFAERLERLRKEWQG
jgi:hypothetical protein